MFKNVLFDRKNNKLIEDKIYYRSALEFLYSKNIISKAFLYLFAKVPFISKLYGYLNSRKFSKFKIRSFIKHFNINEDEFLKNTKEFKSFNDFFIRELKIDVRKIDYDENTLILPCDGRFLAYQNIDGISSFSIKDQKFNLEKFLKDEKLAKKYEEGSMLLCRLAPEDYHRFHFPIDCVPSDAKIINGYLYAVNPIALKQNIKILSENKRAITTLKTKNFSDILYIEIGATNVGSIKQTYFPNKDYKKGEEKGYFALGASAIVLLFEKDSIVFDDDLIKMTKKNIETKDSFGSSFAKKYKRA
ncbi:MAG: Phosphatidylserine decarboxylase proenzyme [Candidatus Anoxychlamydiales bacterium]|nr:Phosphatidylserine decarboxylase proenzyme [Candidatus Anoxychlamydiales bacterium]NGX35627.1 Phosphatidylserine decarboxylase proenzyme [Candidatus Anoxychlamydiales bacterium]